MAPKALLVFCDGTGMDGTLSDPDSTLAQDDPNVLAHRMSTQPEGGSGSKQYATNVLRLSRSVKNLTSGHAGMAKNKSCFYQSGVGSEANFTGDPVTGTTLLQALGTAVASKIRDAYNFVAQNYEDGDDICIFGFSRGAYTARKLSGLIDRIGLLERESLGLFFEIWRQLVDGKTPGKPPGTRYPRISLPATVDVALHAISLQENRKKFLPTLWTPPKGGLGASQVLKQALTSDVGGGYERHELADISLFWMAGEVQQIIELDLEFLRSYEQLNPDPWGMSQPHNAYMETPILQRPVVGHETRLESGQIEKTSFFHESNKYAPQNLKDPSYMVTMSLIAKQFGSGFQPGFASMNKFEKDCQEHWGKPKLTLPPPSSEDPASVIRPAVSWIYGHLGVLPTNAIEGGFEADGSRLYVARAPYAGGIHPGKASATLVHISYDGKEIVIRSNFELLVGARTAVRWIPVSGRLSLDKLGGAILVDGGNEANGATLYVAQAALEGRGLQCGKVKMNGHAHIPYGGKEVITENYSVLAHR
ncbi:hypothetical protein BU15DRAFT_76766 [Melanogaster broomeanus]|nr:hypothetical protein BU15DRAFT_76766 [Melanogaster broomeanus]